MKPIHFARRGVAASFSVVDAEELPPHGEVGQISWNRLVETLQSVGEIKDNEKLSSFQIDERGIVYRVIKQRRDHDQHGTG
jgi:hypothetical protein